VPEDKKLSRFLFDTKYSTKNNGNVKVKVTLKQAMKTLKGSRGIALLFL
jgi:hypothetical protein